MEQLTKNQAVATSQEAVQNQNEPQLRDENAHNDKSVHGVLNPTYQAGLRRDAVQPDIEAERKKRDEIEAGKSYCSRRFGGATCADHRPEGDEKWFLENEKTVTQFCRKLAAERPLKDIRDEYNYPKKKGIKDECSRLLEASTMKSRRGFAIQRLMNAMRQAHADGWFIVFDTLTLADDRLEAFYDNPNALRDYFRDIGRMVLAAEGRKANDSHADCYQYFCVPEYGTANGRLHFHAVHFMRTLPTGSVDPNFGRRVRNRG